MKSIAATDWDAGRYHRISAPQFEWGQRVLERLRPRSGERILDLGCGTARLTREILSAAPGCRVVGLDRSGSMLAVARAAAVDDPAAAIPLVQATGTALPFGGVFDAVFSTATLHWIPDHDTVFASVHAALAPGGRFVAQCGGDGNLDGLLADAAEVMGAAPFREHFLDWRVPWHFADASSTERRLAAAGFERAEAWLEAAPAEFPTADAYAEFVSCVCVRHHLDCLPPGLRDPFVGELTARAARRSARFVLDYRRLNLSAARAVR